MLLLLLFDDFSSKDKDSFHLGSCDMVIVICAMLITHERSLNSLRFHSDYDSRNSLGIEDNNRGAKVR